ncbi:MAG: hypothetical protein SOT80_08050 [Candidatus Pseudoruminococcus sp.]|nr:hypothetical protein [Ruminococcus sp.]MDY2783329.1 hypothetical protein [Candidatus Pseudoruminococcus sp.]
MNFLNTIGSGITQAIDTVVEKNRYIAYTNRLKFVIKSETETLNRAYSALGKHFYKDLKGDPESAEVQRLCKVIDVAQERLKKAQDRLEYVIMYGIPETNKTEEPAAEEEPVIVDSSEEDEGDITICCADNAEDISSPLEIKETAEDVKAESEKSDADDLNIKTDDVDE